MLTSVIKIFAVAALMLATALTIKPVFAQQKGKRSVDQYTCKDVMRESGPSRDVAIAFIHAYLLGRANATTFNVDALHKQTDAFVNRCLDNPNEKALDAMMNVKG
jgi:HdeA/HdeB family